MVIEIITFRRLTLLVFACAAFSIAGTSSCSKRESHSEALSTNAMDLAEGVILNNLPEIINRTAKYLFYLHGRIIEEQGVRPTHPQWGIYEYEKIIEALKRKDFIIVSEARPKGTDQMEYARKLAAQIRTLIKSGVAPQLITVVGASKGAVITMLTSTLLKEQDVNFVTIAACNSYVFENVNFNLYGNILSIYEESDTRNGSCKEEYFKRSEGINRYREIMVNTGLGHGVLYQPLKEWVIPSLDWANGRFGS